MRGSSRSNAITSFDYKCRCARPGWLEDFKRIQLQKKKVELDNKPSQSKSEFSADGEVGLDLIGSFGHIWSCTTWVDKRVLRNHGCICFCSVCSYRPLRHQLHSPLIHLRYRAYRPHSAILLTSSSNNWIPESRLSLTAFRILECLDSSYKEPDEKSEP